LPFYVLAEYVLVPAYESWQQVAGYFDGDGTIVISDTSNQPYKLSLSLIFVDQSAEQIHMLRDFLQIRGVRTSNVLRTSKATAHIIAVSRFESVLAMLKAMLPHLFKKSKEAHAAIDYYEGRIRGNDLADIFKAEVKAGRRENRERRVVIDTPFTYPAGDSLMKAKRKEKIRATIIKTRAKVTRNDYEAIREGHFILGRSLSELVQLYPQYGRETIRRILGRGRGYVLISGEGAGAYSKPCLSSR
jgi:hypothetical protein